MPRSFWKGYLKLSLVTCPVALQPATTDSDKVKFHTMNKATGNRVAAQFIDAETGKPVESPDQAKGFPTGEGEGEYIILEESDLDAVALESTRTIDIDMFVDRDSVDPVWFDSPYYLKPEQDVAVEAFSVIREAMLTARTVGIARLVLNGRERAVMLEPRDRGIVLWTLRYGNEVRNFDEYARDLPELDANLLELGETLVDEMTTHWSPKLVTDPVQEKLLEIIETKKKGRPAPKEKLAAESKPSNVVNIMDALRKSIEEQGRKRG